MVGATVSMAASAVRLVPSDDFELAVGVVAQAPVGGSGVVSDVAVVGILPHADDVASLPSDGLLLSVAGLVPRR
jgi:hypothetical protein